MGGGVLVPTPPWHNKTLSLGMQVAQVLPHPQLIFPSKTWFCGNYLNFQRHKSLENHYLSHSESKSYQSNSIESCSSRSFQQHQRHIPIPSKLSALIWFNFHWRNHQYSRRKFINETLYNFLVDHFSKNFYQLYLLEAFIHSFFRGNSSKLYIFEKKNIVLKIYFKKIINIL